MEISLEHRIRGPDAGAARGGVGVVVCHPHPLFGGTMSNPVVVHVARVLEPDFPVLRFNFRGVGRSEGEYSDGVGERDDVLNMVAKLKEERPGLRGVFVVGYSFGAAVGCSVADETDDILGYVAIAFPFSLFPEHARMAQTLKPKLFINGTRDFIASFADFEKFYPLFEAPKEKVVIDGADHFFTGYIDVLKTSIRDYLFRLAGK